MKNFNPDLYVDITIVRTHLAALKAAGLTGRDIARHSGYGDDFVSKLLRLPNQHVVTRAVADVFLSIHAHQITPATTFIDATGTRRRLEGLAALGWTLQAIADLYGSSTDLIWQMQRRPKVSHETAAKVDAIYRRLSTTAGPSQRTRNTAARNGWVTPAAWDDHEIDDPAASPAQPDADDIVDEIAVERALRGDGATIDRLTDNERAEAIRIGIRRGMTPNAVARLLHVNQKTIYRIRDNDQAAA